MHCCQRWLSDFCIGGITLHRQGTYLTSVILLLFYLLYFRSQCQIAPCTSFVRGKAGKPLKYGITVDVCGLKPVPLTCIMEPGTGRIWRSVFVRAKVIIPAIRTSSTGTGIIFYTVRKKIIHLSGPMTGMRYRDQCRAKEHDLLNKCECIFSLAKHKCGMGLATAMLQETAAHVLAMSV